MAGDIICHLALSFAGITYDSTHTHMHTRTNTHTPRERERDTPHAFIILFLSWALPKIRFHSHQIPLCACGNRRTSPDSNMSSRFQCQRRSRSSSWSWSRDKKSNYVEILSQDSTRSLSELWARRVVAPFSIVFLRFSFFFSLCIFNNFLGISFSHTHTHKYVFIYAKLFIYARVRWLMDGREHYERIFNMHNVLPEGGRGEGDRQAGTSAFKQYKWRTLNQANEHPNKHTNMSKWQIPRRTHTSFTRSRIAHGRPQKLRLMRDNLFGRPRLEGAGTHLHQVCVLEID